MFLVQYNQNDLLIMLLTCCKEVAILPNIKGKINLLDVDCDYGSLSNSSQDEFTEIYEFFNLTPNQSKIYSQRLWLWDGGVMSINRQLEKKDCTNKRTTLTHPPRFHNIRSFMQLGYLSLLRIIFVVKS